MASSMISRLPLAFLLSMALLLPSALGGLICEDLPRDLCAFAISSSSRRCLLESTPQKGGRTVYQCRTSEVVVDGMSDWIETDACVRACGVDRSAVGISSDALLEPQFTDKLCSPDCYQKCPNIVDLYFNLAAGEGAFLPDMCAARQGNRRREMVELLSSGAASGPVSGGVPVASGRKYLNIAPSPLASPPAFA